MWSFSPLSEVLLRRFMDSVEPPDSTNKWIQKFGAKNIYSLKSGDNIVDLRCSDKEAQETSEFNVIQESEAIIKQFECPDTDFLTKFKYLEEKCMKYPELLQKLGETMSFLTAELIFQHIFTDNDINGAFLSYFSQYFVPVFLNINGADSHDILLKLFRLYPEHFKTTFRLLVKESKLPENCITCFILSLKMVEVDNFLNIFLNMELTCEEFKHSLSDIVQAYQSCSQKTIEVQNDIFFYLKSFSKSCTMDKHYGHLLKTFITSLDKQEFVKLKHEIELLIVEHNSVVRKICDVNFRNAVSKHCN